MGYSTDFQKAELYFPLGEFEVEIALSKGVNLIIHDLYTLVNAAAVMHMVSVCSEMLAIAIDVV